MWEDEPETFFEEQSPQTNCLNPPLNHRPPKLKRELPFHEKRRPIISDDSATEEFWGKIEPVTIPKNLLSRRCSFLEFRQPTHDFFWERYGDPLITPYQNVTRPRRTGLSRAVKFNNLPEVRYYHKDEAPIRIGQYYGWDIKFLLVAAWVVGWVMVVELLYKR
jgi:hypothetical protein